MHYCLNFNKNKENVILERIKNIPFNRYNIFYKLSQTNYQNYLILLLKEGVKNKQILKRQYLNNEHLLPMGFSLQNLEAH